MSNIIDSIKLSGVTYTIQGSGGGGNPTVELTQAQYDALVTAGTVQADTYYIITDAQAGDLTNYYTKTETNTLLGGKADTATTYTKTEVDNAITAATSTKQDTLVSGTNIKTINNTSILGSGNIDIQGGGGGGKAIEAGRGISITTGETADTVSFDLPIYKTVSGTAYSLVLNAYSEPSANTFKTKYNTYINCTSPYVDNASGTKNLIMGEACSAMSYAADSFVGGYQSKIGDIRSFAFGIRSEALALGAVAFGYDGQAMKPQVSKGNGSFACGGGTSANTAYSFATGYHNFTTRRSEFASGQYNNSVSATTTFGDSGNTLFSVGNGTADNARHNAFEIRQNGDIYITSGGTDIKLQDNLGGGGGEGTVSALTETNPVALKTNGYYTATTIDTIYLISKFDSTFYDYYTMSAYLSDDRYFEIYTSGNENGITSVSASTAFTSTITDGIAEIKFVSPLTLKEINNLRNRFIAYYFPPTPYTSGSTSEVVEGAVYDSLRKLSLDVLKKDGINDYYIYATDDGIGFNLRTDKNYYSGNLALASPTINFNGGKLNTQFSSTTASQAVINNGYRDYCTLFHSKSYDDITITFNPSYNGGVTQASFTIYAQISEYQSVPKYFTYDIANNSISWSSSDWNTYFTVVDTLSTDHKLKIIANTGYKIAQFSSSECLICGVDHPNPNDYIVTLVTTTSNIHDGQEIIDDLYTNKVDTSAITTSVTSSSTDAQVPSAKAVNDKLGGLSLVKLSQSEYDNLSTYDSNTLYVIVN